MKRILGIAIVALSLGAAAAQAHETNAILTIRHQIRGCHAWSLNGSAYKPFQSGRIHAGSTLTVIDNDVMPHKLVQTSGPNVYYRGNPSMSHMSGKVQVLFLKAGTYTFTTKFGEDYPNMKMGETIGEDNVLKLRIVVVNG
jgi:hypothetical protein